MATELGTAYVQIVPSAQGISGSISKAIGGEADMAGASAGQSFIGKFASFAGKALAVAGIGKLIGESITQGGELEQSIGGVETLFKDSAGKVQEYASQAYKTTGLSANEYMQNVTGFSASLLQSLGGDTAKAADVSNMAMVDMADNANKMGTDMQSIQNAYQGFAKQNYTMLDNLKLGYGGTKEEMERLLADATKLSGVEYNLGNLNDVYQAIHVIQGELDITGTTAKEASQTIQGSLSAMKSAFKDVLGSIATGADLTGPLKALGDTIITFVRDNLFPMLENILTKLPTAVITILSTAGPQLIEAGMNFVANIGNGLGEALPTLIPQVVTLVGTLLQTFLDNLPQVIEAGIALIEGLAQGLLSAFPVLVEKIPVLITSLVNAILTAIPLIIEAGVKLFSALAEGLPTIIQNVVKAIPAIVQGLIQAITKNLPNIVKAGVDLLTALIKNLPEIIKQIASAIPQIVIGIIGAIIKSLPDIINTGKQLFVSLVQALPESIAEIVSKIPAIISGIIKALAAGIPQLVNVGKRLIQGLWEGIQSLASWLWNKVSGFFKGLIDGILNIFGIHSPSKVFSWMGEMNVKGLAKGMEGNVGLVTQAMDDIEAEANRSLQSDFNFSVNTAQNQVRNSVASGVAMPDGEDTKQTKAILDTLKELQVRGDIILDGSALVGALIGRIDEALAQKSTSDAMGGGQVALLA